MAKERILAVDDEEDIMELVRFNLAREGYHVICATSGNECLAIAQKELPELLVLDLMLPDIDGLEITKIMKNNPKTGDIPIVMLTAKGSTAFWAHKHWHETMDGGFLKYMEELNPEESDIIIHFLERVEDFLKRRVQFKE